MTHNMLFFRWKFLKFYGGPAGPPDFIFGGPKGFWALKDPLGPAGPPVFPSLN